MLQLKKYQQASLDVLREYLRKAAELESPERNGADTAFYEMTNRRYRVVPHLPHIPYVCVRIPTGGGKTLIACHSFAMTATEYIQEKPVVCLWLVPSNAIKEQTLKALKNPRHPYRQALSQQLEGKLEVMDLQEARSVTAGTLNGANTIIVTTYAALRVDNTDGRKVYETNGAMAHHFQHLPGQVEKRLEVHEDGTVIYSLANVLKMRSPVVIIDEAHNARTPLSFETLERFDPSCILEFTATPETKHQPEKGKYASNVLCSVTAAELKEEGMIKLPLRVNRRSEWKDAIADAIEKRKELEKQAIEEKKITGEYIRPIVLLQSQPKSKVKKTITYDMVKDCLLKDFKIPEQQVAVVTGAIRETKDEDLFSPDCEIRYIITQQALAEGWDCSFAYVLCSVSDLYSQTKAEQLVGRILRLPNVKFKTQPELNQAYVYLSSENFEDTLQGLGELLVDNGFEEIESKLFVVPGFSGDTPRLPYKRKVEITTTEKPDMSILRPEVKELVSYDSETQTLTVDGVFNEQAEREIVSSYPTKDSQRDAEKAFAFIFEKERRYGDKNVAVPALSIMEDGQLELFEHSHFWDVNQWNLNQCEATLSESEFPMEVDAGEEGEVDISEDGELKKKTLAVIRRDLRLLHPDHHTTITSFATELDRMICNTAIPASQSSLFICNTLDYLVKTRGVTVDQLYRERIRLKNVLAQKMDAYLIQAYSESYQQTLFKDIGDCIKVDESCSIVLDEKFYAPNRYHRGELDKHLFPIIGAFDSKEEEQCANYINVLPEVEFWVRNLDKPHNFPRQFGIPLVKGFFYPDFVCKLKDGRFLVVEYKGKHLWADSEEKRRAGDLWEKRSNGKCMFIMVTDKKFEDILAKIKA